MMKSDHSSASSSISSDHETPQVGLSTPSRLWQSAPDILRFPSVEADERISSWLHRNHPHLSASMPAPSEASDDQSNLGDSSYEFIDTDTESRDGAATESVASTDYEGRQDDTASLASTEQSEDESEDEESHATHGIPSFSGLDGPDSTPTIGQSIAASYEDDRQLPLPIEFEEPLNLGAENVSVKHTVTEFTEDQTVTILEKLLLQSQPQRLVGTIHQTMTKQCLCTKEPLRILYVGSHSAKQDIIHKLASSVAASVDNSPQAGPFGSRTSQLFNVVPVSAFGSEKTPEIELMHSSGVQIKVEDCTYAVNLKYEDEPNRPDVIKLTLDDTYSVHSVPEAGKFIVEPAWEPPHVAIFYSSDNDTIDARRTRTFARTFMTRHKVPCIVISHKQLFDKPPSCIVFDQHAIHMCLESRDPKGPRNIIHQRLPIDLASFMNIDARQMNRNLAYITGLHEPLDYVAVASKVGKPARQTKAPKASGIFASSRNFLRTRTPGQWMTMLPMGALFLSVFVGILANISLRNMSNSVSINGNLTSTGPMILASTTASPPPPPPTSLSTSTETRTSTKTVTVTQSQSPVSNSLALLPKMDIGKLAQKVHILPASKPTELAEEPKTVCSAEIINDREILIRIPTATLTSWLGREAMSVNVSRNNAVVETERAYSTTDGIILQFPRKDAYGILNVSVITTRKPKINETFIIDFGSSWQHDLEDLVEKVSGRVWEDKEVVDTLVSNAYSKVVDFAGKAFQDTKVLSDNARVHLEEANKKAATSSSKLTEVAKVISKKLTKSSAILSKELGFKAGETRFKIERELKYLKDGKFKEGVDNAILKAQIRSRIAWLKWQGKTEEAKRYEVRAGAAAVLKTKQAKRKSARATKNAKKAETTQRRCGGGSKGRESFYGL
jgi:hypothetical protein